MALLTCCLAVARSYSIEDFCKFVAPASILSNAIWAFNTWDCAVMIDWLLDAVSSAERGCVCSWSINSASWSEIFARFKVLSESLFINLANGWSFSTLSPIETYISETVPDVLNLVCNCSFAIIVEAASTVVVKLVFSTICSVVIVSKTAFSLSLFI